MVVGPRYIPGAPVSAATGLLSGGPAGAHSRECASSSVEDDGVKDVSFEGRGCSISTASASMMTEAVKGKSRAEAEALFERFHALITSSPGEAAGTGLGKLAAFSGVCEFPMRLKCASLPWHTLKAALEGREPPVSTE